MSLSTHLQDIEEDIWYDYAQLSRKYGAVDMGLGCPDFEPVSITNVLAQVASSDSCTHQYTLPDGHPNLTKVLSKLYSKLIKRTIAANEILITSGGSEALFCSIMSTVDEGDEVIVIEPYFTPYVSLIKLAGGIPIFVCLKPDPNKHEHGTSADWILDHEELEQLFSRKPKAIILNTPHNPLGKVFDSSEMEMIAELCVNWNVICISDEVYEWIVYQPKKHIRIAFLPDMFERTITIGCVEKSFSVTGWQVGWVYGSSHLMNNIRKLHQLTVYNTSTPLQEAVAMLFEKEMAKLGEDDSYFVTFERQLQEKRRFLSQKLSEAGMKPIVPDGGVFMVSDISTLASRVDLSSEIDQYVDLRFTKWLIKNRQLKAIPTSIFYSEESKKSNEHFVRFCFHKKDDTLLQAAETLNNF